MQSQGENISGQPGLRSYFARGRTWGRRRGMGPGEDDFVVSGKESGPSITTQRAGEKLCSCFIFPLPPRLFVQGFLFLSHVPNSLRGTCGSAERGQALASKDIVSSWQPLPLREDRPGFSWRNGSSSPLFSEVRSSSCLCVPLPLPYLGWGLGFLSVL